VNKFIKCTVNQSKSIARDRQTDRQAGRQAGRQTEKHEPVRNLQTSSTKSLVKEAGTPSPP